MSKSWHAWPFIFAFAIGGASHVQQALAEESLDQPPAAGNPMFAPFNWAGLWETSVANGVTHCTAQFVTPRVILLAAHCVRDQNTGQYYDPDNQDSVFLLQYQNRSWSKLYHALCKATWSGWVVPLKEGEKPFAPDWSKTMNESRRKEYMEGYDKAYQWDYAFVYLDAESTTGYFNYHVNEEWNGAISIGYPHDLMGGSVVQQVEGDVFSVKDLSYSMKGKPNLQVMWHGNFKYTQGSSGGAWVVKQNREKIGPDTNIIVGLNSFSQPGHPGASFGPLFTEDFTKLLKFVDGGCDAGKVTDPQHLMPNPFK